MCAIPPLRLNEEISAIEAFGSGHFLFVNDTAGNVFFLLKMLFSRCPFYEKVA